MVFRFVILKRVCKRVSTKLPHLSHHAPPIRLQNNWIAEHSMCAWGNVRIFGSCVCTCTHSTVARSAVRASVRHETQPFAIN